MNLTYFYRLFPNCTYTTSKACVGLKAINIRLNIPSLEGKHLGDSNGNQKANLKVHRKPTMSEKRSALTLIIKL